MDILDASIYNENTKVIKDRLVYVVETREHVVELKDKVSELNEKITKIERSINEILAVTNVTATKLESIENNTKDAVDVSKPTAVSAYMKRLMKLQTDHINEQFRKLNDRLYAMESPRLEEM